MSAQRGLATRAGQGCRERQPSCVGCPWRVVIDSDVVIVLLVAGMGRQVRKGKREKEQCLGLLDKEAVLLDISHTLRSLTFFFFLIFLRQTYSVLRSSYLRMPAEDGDQ